MALFNGSNVVADPNGLRMSKFTTATRPGSPVQGQVIWNTDTRKLEMYDSGYWKQITDGLRPYLYRTVITTSYALGGYQSSSPWQNGNRIVHATDVNTNLGNVLPYTCAYYSAASGLVRSYQFGANGLNNTSNVIGGFNMATESSAGLTGYLKSARNSSGCVFKETQFAYVCNGQTADVDVFNITSETCYSANQGADTAGGEDGNGAFSDENAGYVWSGSYSNKINFSTTVAYQVTDTNVRGNHGWQQGIGSKLGKGWCGNEGTSNGGYNYRRWVFATDVNIGTVVKPVGNSGEETYDMGQDHNYMMGMHDGAQNNRSQRFSYTTESGYEVGAGTMSQGVGGRSSGQMAWKG